MSRPRPGLRAREVRAPRHGVGRRSSPSAERVSDDLRLGSGNFLPQRRGIAALSLTAAACYAVVGLYQFGLIRRVPEPSASVLDADRVDASGEAYALLRTPDAALGLTSAGITMVLVGMGDNQRHRERPWVPLVAAGKVIADAGGSVVLFAEQLTKHRRLCSWCTLAAACNLAAVPLAMGEARAAWSAIRHRATD